MSTNSPPRYLLDTSIVSAIIHRVGTATSRFHHELNSQAEFLLCPVVWHEMRRGLLRMQSSRKLQVFDQLAATFVWDEIVQPDWQLVTQVWPQMVAGGQRPGDWDLLIAAFAARRQAIVVTQNQRHFLSLAAFLPITIQNWA